MFATCQNCVSHVLLDEPHSLSHAGGEDVGVGPGLGAQSRPLLPPQGVEGDHLGVEGGDRPEHGLAGVRDELLAHQLEPPVYILLGVEEVLLHGGGRVKDELQQGVIAADRENIRSDKILFCASISHINCQISYL